MGDETSSSDCETTEENVCDVTLIGEILGRMKSEFNKADKNEQETIEIEDDASEAEAEEEGDPPPVLTIEEQIRDMGENGDDSSDPPDIKEAAELEEEEEESKSTDEIYSAHEEAATGVKMENGVEDNKPRIVLTFRTDKSKPVVVSTDKSGGDKSHFVSPGRRSSQRIKNAPSDDPEPELKRSARRRSKDCNESVLQSAIARKEKSYNETAKPQRLTRRLKPTAKILENLAMCQQSRTTSQRNAAASPKAEDRDRGLKRHKRKHSNKSPKTVPSPAKRLLVKETSPSNSESDHSVSSDTDMKTFEVVKVKELKEDSEDGDGVPLCLCRQRTKLYISSADEDVVYCTAVDNISGRLIGCNNVIEGKEIALLRPSTRVPYAILCDVHRERMLRHNCCATCGLFCTQGHFVQCQSMHHYHRECQVRVADVDCCPHCGIPTPDHDVTITMHSEKRPAFVPTQREPHKAAKMTLQPAKERSPSPPLIPPEAIEIDVTSDAPDAADIATIFEAVRSQDHRQLATILSTQNLKLNVALEDTEGTVLHFAAREGFLVAVHMLTVAGAEIDQFDKDQNTPLMLAVLAFQNETVRYLIKAGSTLSLKGTDGMTSLHLAAKCGNLEACKLLVAVAAGNLVNLTDDGGWTALVWACEHSHLDIVEFLLRKGADALFRDVEQNVSLHWAAFSGNSAIAQLLIDHGCDVNSINAHGDSPLHIAARQDTYNCVVLLLSRGAHVNIANKTGETPLECSSGDCYNAISLNVHLQNSPYDARIILSKYEQLA